MRYSSSLIGLLPLVLLHACARSPGSGPVAATPGQSSTVTSEQAVASQPQPSVTVSPEVVAEVAAGFNVFGLELYRELSTTRGDQVISPASVAVALAMTHAGARGDTATEIEAALHFPRPAAEVHAAVGSMLVDWNQAREETELAVANRLFGAATMSYEQPYLDLVRTVFLAPLEPLDFQGAPEAARVTINDWVEEQTHDRIQDLLPQGSIDSSTLLVLVNAIYFKSQWAHPFPEELTAPAPFFGPGRRRSVPTMHLTDDFAFTESSTDGVQVIELPYVDPGFSMVLVVPTARAGLAAVEAGLTAERLDGWIGALANEHIALSLPKFRIAPAESLRLTDPLGELGIRKAFTAEADLTGIAPSGQLQLDDAYHKGFIVVDEKGTEAAAATAVVGIRSAPTDEPRVVKVDRPFLYFIRDTRSGLVMFMGRVVDPRTNG